MSSAANFSFSRFASFFASFSSCDRELPRFFFCKLSITLFFSRSGELSSSSDLGALLFFFDFLDDVDWVMAGGCGGSGGGGDGDPSVPIIPDSISMTFSIVLILFSICNYLAERKCACVYARSIKRQNVIEKEKK